LHLSFCLLNHGVFLFGPFIGLPSSKRVLFT